MTALSDLPKYSNNNNLTPPEVLGVADLSGDGKVNNLDLQALINDLANGGGSTAQFVGSGSSKPAAESGNPSSQPGSSIGTSTTVIVSSANPLATAAVVSQNVSIIRPIVASSGTVGVKTSTALAIDATGVLSARQSFSRSGQADVAARLSKSIANGAVFGEAYIEQSAGTIAAHESLASPRIPAPTHHWPSNNRQLLMTCGRSRLMY
jgi:hypothetical protein